MGRSEGAGIRYGLYFVTFVQFLGALIAFTKLQGIMSATGFPRDLNALFYALFIVVHLLA